MTTVAEQATSDTAAIRPFHVHFPDEALADLKHRIAATRWPGREIVTDQSQGVQLATAQKLARYWGTEYDWRKWSAFPEELYQAPQSWTERAYPKLVYYKRHDKGGHFAAWEQPELLVSDLRAAFKSLR